MKRQRHENEIRECCTLHFYGKSFTQIADLTGFASSTIHRWSETDVWGQEWQRLINESQKSRDEVLAQQKQKYRELLEKSGLDAIEIATKTLMLAHELTGKIDISQLDDVESQVRVLSQLARVFKDLQSCGASNFLEIFELDRDEDGLQVEILFQEYTPEELANLN